MLSRLYEESFNMLGYFQTDTPFLYSNNMINSTVSISCKPELCRFILSTRRDNGRNIIVVKDFKTLINYILDIQEEKEYQDMRYEKELIEGNSIIYNLYPIFAKRDSARKQTEKIIRVKSSNVWGYSFQINSKSNTGNLFVQFKSKTGGPGDIYEYFDFPLRMWRKFTGTSSKGHFFWKYIRDVYRYRKLTGDKRGKLINAVN